MTSKQSKAIAVKLEDALHTLLRLLDEGMEYPEALAKAAREHGVRQQALQAEYDTLG